MNRRAVGSVAAASLLLVLAACSAGAPTALPEESGMPMASDAEEGFAWGEPADGSDADRTIEIQMLDALVFEPATVEVRVGETVTFAVVNAGQLPHDFTLGDEAAQAEHEEEMSGGMAGHEEPNVLELEAGESGELTWHFTQAGTIFYGCHVPGHYAAGMRGTISITES